MPADWKGDSQKSEVLAYWADMKLGRNKSEIVTSWLAWQEVQTPVYDLLSVPLSIYNGKTTATQLNSSTSAVSAHSLDYSAAQCLFIEDLFGACDVHALSPADFFFPPNVSHISLVILPYGVMSTVHFYFKGSEVLGSSKKRNNFFCLQTSTQMFLWLPKPH